MATSSSNSTSNSYSDGIQKWSTPKVAQAIQQPIDQTTIQVVVGCNIKTDIINQTFKIISNLNPSFSLAHFQNSQVTEWSINTNNIILTSCDSYPLTLIFESAEEALVGDKRLWKIMEGGNIIACGDENL